MAQVQGDMGGGTSTTQKSPYAIFLEEQARRNAGQTPTPAGARASANSSSSSTGYGYGGSGGGAGDRQAANNLGVLANYNADSVKDQLHRSNQNFDQADQQNRQLATQQFGQNSRKTANERFAQQKKLQASTSGILSAAGNAMQGSGVPNLLNMLDVRNDLDTGESLGMLTQNQNAVLNALNESLNANAIARNDATSTAEFGLRGIEADTASQLGNIDPKLFVAPGTGAANVGSAGYAAARRTPNNIAASTGYFLPPTTSHPRRLAAAPAAGGSYYETLLNSFRRSS